jgi:hypothetical protein
VLYYGTILFEYVTLTPDTCWPILSNLHHNPHNKIKLLLIVLQVGADTETISTEKDRDGKTPLDVATAEGASDEIKALLLCVYKSLISTITCAVIATCFYICFTRIASTIVNTHLLQHTPLHFLDLSNTRRPWKCSFFLAHLHLERALSPLIFYRISILASVKNKNLLIFHAVWRRIFLCWFVNVFLLWRIYIRNTFSIMVRILHQTLLYILPQHYTYDTIH